MSIINSVKHKKTVIIILSVLLLSAIVSTVLFAVKTNGKRRTFIFPSVENGKYIVESRRLPKLYMNPVEVYVNELLLGPQTERTQRIFPNGTKLKSCMVRDKTVYINISKEMIDVDEKSNITMRESIELLEKNIKNNFRFVDSVEVFVDGNAAYNGY